MKAVRAFLVLVVLAASLEVSGQVIDPPPACVTADHPSRSGFPTSKALATCPTEGRCDQPANRDAAIPGPETPIKYISVKFQTVAKDDGSSRPFSRAEAADGIDWLNFCFDPWRIQFVFDHRVVYSTDFNNIHDDWQLVGDLGNQFSIDPQRNLNIITTYFWCDWQGNRTLCGGAQPPWPYPVTAPSWAVLMTVNHWPHGGLICHEVGHNFGLIHTFGNFGVGPCDPCDEVVGRGNGDTTGDFCSDTPPTPINPWNTRCAPAYGNDPCSGRPWGETDYRNWMAYTPYAPCKDHFTAQQAGRAHCWLENALTGWISYAKIEPDVDFGPAPLEVQFEGMTSMRANEWSWDFGEGTTGQGQSSSHIFASPGVYTPAVSVDAAEGVFEATMSRDVWVYAGDVTVDDVVVPPGAQTIEVSISAANSVPVDSVDLPLRWDGPANLVLESVSTVGFRSQSFPPPEWISLDSENGRGCLRVMTVIDSLAMPPSEGEFVKLVFTVDPDLERAQSDIRLEDHGECRLQFVTDRGAYVPDATDGSVRICEGRNCDRELAARRPARRRRP